MIEAKEEPLPGEIKIVAFPISQMVRFKMSVIYALSIKQPWAAMVVTGLKTIEVRSWSTRIRGRILIHAARIPDHRPEAWKWITDDIRPLTTLGGGIIGDAELFDCVSYADANHFEAGVQQHLNDPSWFQARGLYGFCFRNMTTRPFRPVSGNVRFFRVEDE